ncbi:MAG: Ubiquinone biosynthesis O-methyltransferase [Alphaproteobacteria bacterium MarineAlpha5_Bin5]|nr:MAG: Ubiquinone biosynthesis O-methyltransferase [Alphaproteobacteria bacterium MarineAlpha5_Bin5]PPR51312.1 MAG: Ubiquinone biosynthesis O-methyltransferase [Alphaproteobacteria bacterium MarineAlpha5_Bin4]
MMNTRSKLSEFEHFTKLADQWWSESGKFKILHDLQPLRVQYIIDQIWPKKINKLKILDLGCGGGLVCEPLAKLGANVTGVDFVKQNIEAAKIHAMKNKLKINYIHKDVNDIKLKSSYDVIIAYEVLEHLKDWPDLIKKIKTLLKANGKLIISTINRNFFSKIIAIYFAEKILKWIPEDTHDYNKFIKPKELETVLQRENFKVNNFTGLVFNPIENIWKLNANKTKINYFCSAKLI